MERLVVVGTPERLPERVDRADWPVFHALHGTMTGSAESLSGFRPDHAEFWGQGYRPHATVVSGAEGARRISITNLAVASLTGPRARVLVNCRLAAGS